MTREEYKKIILEKIREPQEFVIKKVPLSKNDSIVQLTKRIVNKIKLFS